MTTTLTAIAQTINDAYAAGEKMTIKGREVKAYPGGKPAQVWGNGSLSIDVPAKTKANRITQMWFKPGAEAELLKHFERGC